MAVEKSKVINRLKALFPKANLSQQRLDALADKLAQKPADDADDAAIDVVINNFNDVLSIEDIAKEDDRLRTLEAKSKKPTPTPTPNPSPNPNPEPTPQPKGDEPEYVRALFEKLNKVTSDLDSIKQGKIIENKQSQASTLFSKSEVFKDAPQEVKDFFIKNIDVNSETPFDEQIKGLEDTYSKMVQTSADTGDYSGFPPANGKQPEKFSKEDADAIVDQMNV